MTLLLILWGQLPQAHVHRCKRLRLHFILCIISRLSFISFVSSFQALSIISRMNYVVDNCFLRLHGDMLGNNVVNTHIHQEGEAEICSWVPTVIETSKPQVESSRRDNTPIYKQDNYLQRFSSIGRLYDRFSSSTIDSRPIDPSLSRLSNATVAVVGLGGVGSWVAEALVRSGILNLILVDLDDICVSNINRQVHSTTSNVGKLKIDVMKQRLLDISPSCSVTCIYDFVR